MHLLRTLLPTLVLTALVLPLVMGADASTATTAVRTPPLVPESGVLLGAHVDPDNVAYTREEVVAFEQQIGRPLAVDHRFVGLDHPFPTAMDRWDVDSGRVPMITWEPFGTTLDALASGQHDELIRQRARDVVAFGDPVFLRFAHEMNGDWYPWSGEQNHTHPRRQRDGAAKYVAAWRHVHDVFRSEGAGNAVWVWAPNHADAPARDGNHWTDYYPGDAYVDWVGIDGYNWGDSQHWSTWTSFADVFGAVYADYAGRKPIMISETSSTESGGDKAAWIDAARTAVRERFPAIAAFVWFEVNKEQDWRAGSSPASLEAFRRLANDVHFGGTQGEPPAPPEEPVVTGPLHLAGLSGSRAYVGGRWSTATAIATVADANGVPVAGATVAYTWSGAHSGSGTCTTGADGSCAATTPKVFKNAGGFQFTVTAIQHELGDDPTADTVSRQLWIA